MDGEANGGGTEAQDAQGSQAREQQGQAQGSEGKQPQVGGAPDYERAIAERDEKIAALEAQVADAAKSAEAADELRKQIDALKAQGESDRVDFQLRLAGVRNVKAARAVLGDYEGDVDKLKESEPWLFADKAQQAGGGASSTTGLPNAGAASDSGRTLKRWRRIAGLEDTDE